MLIFMQDTVASVESRDHELNAALTSARRLQIAAELSDSVRELALAGLRQRH